MSEGNGSTKKPFKREPLIDTRIKLAEFVATDYRAVLEQGTTLDEIKEPKFWAHCAVKLRQYDEIRCIEESGAFRAHLLVTACDRNWAMVEVLDYKQLREQTPVEATPKAPTLEEYRVAWRGPHHKWCAERVSDNQRLFSGGQSKLEAETWLAQHSNTLSKTVVAAAA